jgi:uncharacterized protein
VAGSDPETLVRAYEALNEGDAEAALTALHPAAEWRESAELPETGVYRGREQIGAFLHEFLESWEDFHQEIEEVMTVGDRVAVFVRFSARGRRSGVHVDARYCHLWTMRDGLGVRVEGYAEPDAARAALEREPAG